MNEKICTKCKKSYPKTEFHKDCKKSDGLSSNCKLCRREIDAKAYIRKRDYNIKRGKEWRLRNKAVVDLIKSKYGCILCDENDTVCIDLHHLNDDEKYDNVKEMLHHSLKNLLKEIAKCVTLCANCHRKVHAGRIEIPSGTKPIDISEFET